MENHLNVFYKSIKFIFTSTYSNYRKHMKYPTQRFKLISGYLFLRHRLWQYILTILLPLECRIDSKQLVTMLYFESKVNENNTNKHVSCFNMFCFVVLARDIILIVL